MRIHRTPQILKEDEITKIANTILESQAYMPTRHGDFLKIRDSYAWLIINALGLRPKECLQLKWEDIDIENRIIKLSPYWNKVRIDIPAILTKPAIRLILDYKDKLNKLGFYSPYLFPSLLTGEPVSVGNYGRRFLTAAKEAGIAKIAWYTEGGQPKYNVKVYTGRHNFCTTIWRKTHDTTCVKECARHLKLESAQAYIHLDNKDKINIVDEIWE